MTATIDSVVFQTVASPVLVLDPLGRIIRLNPACERLGGRATEQVAGHDYTDLLCETPE
jgi:PAS domain-containing protein